MDYRVCCGVDFHARQQTISYLTGGGFTWFEQMLEEGRCTGLSCAGGLLHPRAPRHASRSTGGAEDGVK